MAATGKTPILLYGSTTPTNAPTAGNLTNSSDGCEIAINVADKNLFFKDSGNVVNTVPIRQSSASSNGWLSSTDWSTFNSKQPAGTYVTSVTGTAPVVSSGGTTPVISMAAATGSVNGYLTSTDWTTFNNKVSSQWTTTGSNIYYTAGSVGVGNSTITSRLQVLGSGSGNSLNICNAANADTGAYINSSGNTEMMLSAGASYNSYSSPNFVMNAKSTLANGIYLNGADCKWWANTGLTAGTTFNQTTVATLAGSTGNLTLSVGNLVIGTSGKGIDFSATPDPAGMTSELLADYEEGTWTPAYGCTSGAFGTITYGLQVGSYTKVGRLVTISAYFRTESVAAGTAAGNLTVTGLPYTPKSGYAYNGTIGYSASFASSTVAPTTALIQTNGVLNFYYRATSAGNGTVFPASGLLTGTNAASNYVFFTITYEV